MENGIESDTEIGINIAAEGVAQKDIENMINSRNKSDKKVEQRVVLKEAQKVRIKCYRKGIDMAQKGHMKQLKISECAKALF